ncbi:EamA family transporter [Fodinibius roseus]
MDASLATSFLYLVPVVTILQGWIWLGEVPEMMAILGGTVALAGAAVVNQN